MNNRIKNLCILIVLTIFLLVIEIIPVNCFFKQITGISCPACGMTRAFHSIMNFNFYKAFSYNILSIPLFIFISISFLIFIYEIISNKFNYAPYILKILSNKYVIILITFFIIVSFILNNL